MIKYTINSSVPNLGWVTSRPVFTLFLQSLQANALPTLTTENIDILHLLQEHRCTVLSYWQMVIPSLKLLDVTLNILLAFICCMEIHIHWVNTSLTRWKRSCMHNWVKGLWNLCTGWAQTIFTNSELYCEAIRQYNISEHPNIKL
jgi:hypothetical protein